MAGGHAGTKGRMDPPMQKLSKKYKILKDIFKETNLKSPGIVLETQHKESVTPV